MTFRTFSLLLVATLVSATCATAADVPTPRAHPTHGTALERIVAIVNDGVVTESELDAQVSEVTQRLRAQNVTPPAADVMRSQVLERLVLETIQEQRADHAGITVSDEHPLRRDGRLRTGDPRELHRQRQQDGNRRARRRRDARKLGRRWQPGRGRPQQRLGVHRELQSDPEHDRASDANSGGGNNLNGSDPKLGVLADNGGETKTMKPAPDSPMVDKGKDFVGTGKDQRGVGYSAWYASVPGVKVIAPYSAADAKGLLKAAIRDPNPMIFLENEIVYGRSFPVPKIDDFVLPIGKARIVKPGKDVTLVSYSISVGTCEEAAQKLAEEGIDAEIIDLRTLRPLDMETVLASVKKTNRIVTVEQAWPVCSIGSEIASRVALEAFDYLDAPPTKVTGKDVPMPYAANLEKLALPTVDDVIAAAKAVCYKD